MTEKEFAGAAGAAAAMMCAVNLIDVVVIYSFDLLMLNDRFHGRDEDGGDGDDDDEVEHDNSKW